MRLAANIYCTTAEPSFESLFVKHRSFKDHDLDLHDFTSAQYFKLCNVWNALAGY